MNPVIIFSIGTLLEVSGFQFKIDPLIPSRLMFNFVAGSITIKPNHLHSLHNRDGKMGQ
jgi:hypothetical protein